jgi:uncharacterized protein YdhG (YjbR/CyaY superfamily)
MAEKSALSTVDDYIAGFPPEVQDILRQIRDVIREAAPDATEAIKYRMPTFVLEGNLVHFAAYKAHIGLYPTPSGIDAFAEELAPYAGGKGSVRFPLDQPIPFELIRRIILYRVQENLDAVAAKGRKR